MDMQSQKDFIELIQKHQGIINSICLTYFRDSDDLKDARQDVILQLWRSLPTFRGDSLISTWIYKVTLNTILSRKNIEEKRSKNEPLTEHHLSHNPEYPFQISDENEEFKYLIDSLNASDKAVLILLMEGYSNKEIADILHYTPSNVSTRLSRIKEKLKNKYNNELK